MRNRSDPRIGPSHCRLEKCRSVDHGILEIVENPSQSVVGAKHRCKQRAVTTADIDQYTIVPEIEALERVPGSLDGPWPWRAGTLRLLPGAARGTLSGPFRTRD